MVEKMNLTMNAELDGRQGFPRLCVDLREQNGRSASFKLMEMHA
jgi:hypothetical protein